MQTKQKWKPEIPTRELFFYLHFSLLLFAKGIGLYEGQKWYTVILLVSLLFFVLKLCVSRYTGKELICIGIIGAMAALCYFFSREKGVILYACMVIGMKDMSLPRVCKVGFWVWTVSFLGVTACSFLSIPETAFKVHAKLGLGHMFRWGLGYSHPNVLHISYLVFLIFLIYSCKQKFSLKSLLWMFLGNCLVFLFSVSYTGFAIVTFYLLGNYYWAFRGKFHLWEKVLAQMFLPACVLVSLAAPVLLSGKSFDVLNKLLNTRLSLSQHFLTIENITLFGKSLQDITNQWMTMDSSYVYGLIAYGVVFFVVFFSAFAVLIHHLIKLQKGKEVWIVLAILAAGLTEPFMFNTSYKNVAFLFLGVMIFGGRQAFSYPEAEPEGAVVTEWVRRKRKWLVLCVGVGIIGAILCGIFVKMPDKVVVPRKECADIGKDSSVYLEPDDDLFDGNVWILGYRDAQTPMEVFAGNIIIIEYVRACIGSGVFIAALLYLLLYGAAVYRQKREKRVYG